MATFQVLAWMMWSVVAVMLQTADSQDLTRLTLQLEKMKEADLLNAEYRDTLNRIINNEGRSSPLDEVEEYLREEWEDLPNLILTLPVNIEFFTVL